MEIVPAPTPGTRDLSIVDKTLSSRVLLLPTIPPVRAGLPLVCDNGGWRGAKANEPGQFYATTFAYGGETCDVARAIIVETHIRSLTPGRCRIVDQEANGPLRFVNDPTGPYLALNRSQVLMG